MVVQKKGEERVTNIERGFYRVHFCLTKKAVERGLACRLAFLHVSGDGLLLFDSIGSQLSAGQPHGVLLLKSDAATRSGR